MSEIAITSPSPSRVEDDIWNASFTPVMFLASLLWTDAMLSICMCSILQSVDRRGAHPDCTFLTMQSHGSHLEYGSSDCEYVNSSFSREASSDELTSAAGIISKFTTEDGLLDRISGEILHKSGIFPNHLTSSMLLIIKSPGDFEGNLTSNVLSGM